MIGFVIHAAFWGTIGAASLWAVRVWREHRDGTLREFLGLDRSGLPGGLYEPEIEYRDDAGHHEWLRSLHEDEWEAEHVDDALTLAGQPSLEDIDCAMWELELTEGSER